VAGGFLPWLLPRPLMLPQLVCNLGSAATDSELGGSVDLLEGSRAPQSRDPLKAGTGEERRWGGSGCQGLFGLYRAQRF